MNVISFSLFGDIAKYTTGMISNLVIAPHMYPGWQVRVYHDLTVPAETRRRLSGLGAQLVDMTGHFSSGMFWRFLVADDPGVTRWLVRDADSRLGYRERRAVDEWIESDLPFHILRDHPWHEMPILGSGFGGRSGVIPAIEAQMRAWGRFGSYGDDEHFLARHVYPRIREHAMVHDDWNRRGEPRCRPFPSSREGHTYVGEPYDEFEHFRPDLRDVLIQDSNTKGLVLFAPDGSGAI